jgi:hypothetical protein
MGDDMHVAEIIAQERARESTQVKERRRGDRQSGKKARDAPTAIASWRPRQRDRPCERSSVGQDGTTGAHDFSPPNLLTAATYRDGSVFD